MYGGKVISMGWYYSFIFNTAPATPLSTACFIIIHIQLIDVFF